MSATPWTEKHRPPSLDSVSAQHQIVTTLKSMVLKRDVPHLLMHGPPGSGKTSTALALARDLYGDATLADHVLELNASDERGIKVVRERIKVFASTACSQEFQIVILDDASMWVGCRACARSRQHGRRSSRSGCARKLAKRVKPFTCQF